MIEGLYTGTVEGTGAAITISCGFIPRYVKLINIDGDATMEWTNNLANGEGFKDLPTGVMALMASGGVTPSSDTSTYRGFSIGTDADVNASGETLLVIAMR